MGLNVAAPPQFVKKAVQEDNVITLQILHRSAHARKALAEAEIVSRVVLGRFAFAPVPVAAILEIDNEDVVIMDDGLPGLEAEIVYTTDAFLEYLGSHDRGSDR